MKLYFALALTILFTGSVYGAADNEAARQGPLLIAQQASFFEGETVTLSCSANAPLRYCYFRAGGYNGSTYTVFPGMSSSGNFEYVGNGFESGQCGIRFRTFMASDSGEWSCHAGLTDVTADELRTDFVTDVRPRATATLFLSRGGSSSSARGGLVVEARTANNESIEYCRFVRINGHGFTSDNVPEGYSLWPTLDRGLCSLDVGEDTILNRHPWAVAVKIQGVPGEVAMTTNFLISSSTTEEPVDMTTQPPHEPPHVPPAESRPIYGEVLFWVLIAVIILVAMTAAFALIPKKNREFTRNSFRRSWDSTFKREKKPAQPQYENQENKV